MYGTNIILYRNPVPQCNQVISTKECLSYYAFARNYNDELTKASVSINPINFSAHWGYRLFEFTFYTVSGGSSRLAYYIFVSPLPGISVAAITVFILGITLFLVYSKKLVRQYPHLGFLVFISAFFLATLWYRNYSDYLQYGERVGINGRYLVPILLPIVLAIILAFQELLKDKTATKIALLTILILFLLQGGGALSFINSSNSNWYWGNDKPIDEINNLAQKIVKPTIYHHNLFHIVSDS
jgi:hypothetical protein